jgi:hypothetical protein
MAFKNRMGELNFWAIPLKGTPEREQLDAILSSDRSANPALNKKIKTIVEKARALLAVQSANGAGLPLDKMLREYNNEYNNRVFQHSLRHMPTSFNTMEAFNAFLPPTATFKLRKEKNYLISFIDYLDYITSRDTDQNIPPEDLLTTGVIYSYNGSHDPLELSFNCSGDKEFCVSGISMIRHENELNVMMLAGMICDLDEMSKELNTQQPHNPPPHKTGIIPDENLAREAVPLIDGTNLWKTIVHSRIDLKTNSMDVRYIAQDCGDSFFALTDNISAFMDERGEFFSERYEEIAKSMPLKVSEYQSLFEFIKVCIDLPAFIHNKEDELITERHPTRLKELQSSTKNKKAIKLADGSEHFYFRNVLFLPSEPYRINSHKTFYNPNIKMETSGYWKPLTVGSVGQDKAGQPIHGRTWVEKTLSWVEAAAAPQPLHTRTKSKLKTGENPGYIYVMRCAAHGKNIFKIGLTSRTTDIRAQELTGETSSPDQFLIVEEWDVADCELAEDLIHEQLDDYRLNPKREFFKARYSIIHTTVTEIVERINA